MERAEAYRVHIEWALRHQDKFGRPISLNAAADKVNERHLQSPMGGRWYSNRSPEPGREVSIPPDGSVTMRPTKLAPGATPSMRTLHAEGSGWAA